MTDLAAAPDTAPVLRSVAAPASPPGVVRHLHPVPYAPPGRRSLPSIAALLLIAVVAYLADVATKLMVVATLSEDTPVRLGNTGVEFRLIRNPGAAFGVGVGATVLFTLVTALVIAVILLVSHRLNSLPWALTLGLLLGGSMGNLTDRLARSPGPFRGHVVDFVHVQGWPIFNLADAAIVTAGVMIVLLALRNVPLSGRRH
ncbi:MAG: signal peptidase II [Sporichthyaceae bacterium]